MTGTDMKVTVHTTPDEIYNRNALQKSKDYSLIAL